MIDAAVVAFNLICHAQELSGKIATAGRYSKTDISITYRIDLDKGRWCQDDCQRSFPIAKVEDTRLLLELDSENALGTDTVTIVDRETGGFSRRTRYGLKDGEATDQTGVVLDQGSCEKAPFTGLPVAKF